MNYHLDYLMELLTKVADAPHNSYEVEMSGGNLSLVDGLWLNEEAVLLQRASLMGFVVWRPVVRITSTSSPYGWASITPNGRALLEAMRDKQMMDVLRKNVVGSGNDYDSGMWVKFPCMISELNDGYWILDAVAKCLHGKEQKKHDEAR